METKEMSYNELVINGFMALFFNLVMLPALVFLNFLIFGQLPWLSIPVLFMLVLLFVLMLPGYLMIVFRSVEQPKTIRNIKA